MYPVLVAERESEREDLVELECGLHFLFVQFH
jgi:hypothetical protein